HSPLAAFQFFIPLLPERLVDPAVYLLPILALESDLSTAVQKCLNLLQAQSFRCLHADGQVPACGFAPPGSSCMRNRPTSRLILYETRLRSAQPHPNWYD